MMDESLEIPGSSESLLGGRLKALGGGGAPLPPSATFSWLTHTHAPDDAAAGDGRVHYGDGTSKLALEHTVGTRSQ